MTAVRWSAVRRLCLWPTARGRCSCRPLSFHNEFRPLHHFNPSLSHVGLADGQRHTYASQAHGPTIYALSTAPGRAAIAVIRISGPACLHIYQALCPGKSSPKARRAIVRTLYRPNQPPSNETILDPSALLLYFPSPGTVTGEDVLELHVHGGPAIVKAVLSAISESSPRTGAIRYAEAGEFTRRAFMNDRLDLTQVEALGDVLSATTEQQRKLSVRGTSNVLAKRYEGWRHQLLYARGELEALIDFSEDQHFDESPAELCASVAEQVRELRSALMVHRTNAVRGELLRNGLSISLLGAPNAGKSSLLNRIIGREAAIVSQEAGTTRDVVEVGLDLGGYFCRLADTAGLRTVKVVQGLLDAEAKNSIGLVEKEGMRRAKERAAESDVVIVVLSLEKSEAWPNEPVSLILDPEVTSTAAALIPNDNVIVVVNKADSALSISCDHVIATVTAALPGLHSDKVYLISCRDANSLPGSSSSTDPGGIQAFLQGLIQQFAALTSALTPDSRDTAAGAADASIWQESLGATERHRLLLEDCLVHLDDFLNEVAAEPMGDVASPVDAETQAEADIVVAAEHLRSAADCLAKITGRGEAGDVEEVLGVVFEKFCVGK